MRRLLAATSCLAATASATTDTTNIIMNIVALLQKSRQENQESLSNWESYFKKTTCWCKKVNQESSISLVGKVKELEAEKDSLEKAWKASVQSKNNNEKNINVEMNHMSYARSQAAHASEEAQTEKEKMEGRVRQLTKAIEVLKNPAAGAKALLQAPLADITADPAMSSSLSMDQQSALAEFLTNLDSKKSFLEVAPPPQAAAGGTPHPRRAESVQHGEVIGILVQMKDDLERQLEDMKGIEEERKAANLAELVAINNKQTEAQRAQAKDSNAINDMVYQIAQLTSTIAALEKQQEENVKTKGEAAATCADLATEYNEAIQEITEENKAIGEAIPVLQKGLANFARGQGIKSQRNAGFVQVAAKKSFIGTVKNMFAHLSHPSSFLQKGEEDSGTVTQTYVTEGMVAPLLELLKEMSKNSAEAEAAEGEDFNKCKTEIASYQEEVKKLKTTIEMKNAEITEKETLQAQKEEDKRVQQKILEDKEGEMSSAEANHKELTKNLEGEIKEKSEAIKFLEKAVYVLQQTTSFIQTTDEGDDHVAYVTSAPTMREEVSFGKQGASPTIGEIKEFDPTGGVVHDKVEESMDMLTGAMKEKPQARKKGVKGPVGLLQNVLTEQKLSVQELTNDLQTEQSDYGRLTRTLTQEKQSATDNMEKIQSHIDEFVGQIAQCKVDIKVASEKLNGGDGQPGVAADVKTLELACEPLLKQYGVRKQYRQDERATYTNVQTRLNTLIGTELTSDA